MKWTLIAFVASMLAGYCVYDDFDPGTLNGKNVVITGESAGIGEQMAYHYARMGARILITSRTEADLKKVVERCRKEGSPDGVYLYHAADMSDPLSAVELIEDGVLDHMAKLAQDWIATKCSEYIDKGEWPPTLQGVNLLIITSSRYACTLQAYHLKPKNIDGLEKVLQ